MFSQITEILTVRKNKNRKTMNKSEQAAFREEEIHAKKLTGKIMI